MHARFRHNRSDFMAWLNLWRYYEERRQALSQNQLRKLCKREYLSYLRMREWRDIHTQLSIACRQQGLRVAGELPQEENYRGIHIALLSGLLGNIAQLQEGREYLGSRNRKLVIFPGSSLARKPPKWLVAAEIVETSRVYARGVGAIDPAWAVGINPALLKHHYYQPRWQARSGRVMAYERLSLYGLTLSDKRSVHYGPIAPAESRALLIREGLIAGNYRQPPGFLKHNQGLVKELEDLESRTRRRDILADEQVLYQFYDERLPPDAYTAGRLRGWLKRDPGQAEALKLTREVLQARDPGHQIGEQFPDHLQWDDMRLRLSYRFEPGKIGDGVSVTIPVALLNRVPRYLFDWLVPGLLREKCIAMVKGLPKEKRKRLVPVPDRVDNALAGMTPGDVDLLSELADALARLGGVKLSREDWDMDGLDDYYRMNIRVVDANGKLLEQGRDLDALVRRFREDTRESISTGKQNALAREGIVRWDFDELPREWKFRQAGQAIVAWPALVDRGDSVAIELCDYAHEALSRHRLGVLRLLKLANAQQVKYLRKQLLRGNEFNLLLAGADLERAPLVEDMIDAAYAQAMQVQSKLPYTREAFREMEQAGRGDVVSRASELEAIQRSSLSVLAQVRHKLAAMPEGKWTDTREDIAQQLQDLLRTGFQRDTPRDWLAQYPRYMKALLNRVERLSGQYAKDQSNTALLQVLATPLRDAESRCEGLLQRSEQACEYRWMLEELRVSLFAQNLGTRKPVSKKRLEEQWLLVQQWLDENPY
jgi:ATP-dependent helicase HrpA